jgi:electron transport complex protein RnfE
MIAMMLMGSIREVLGVGTFLGHPLLGPNFEPWLIMVLPPGGFLTLGIIMLGRSWFTQRRAA